MPGTAIIELNSVNVFQQKHLVLANLGLRIEKGEMVYLVGKRWLRVIILGIEGFRLSAEHF